MLTVYIAMYGAFIFVILFAAIMIWDLCTPEYYVESKKDLEKRLSEELRNHLIKVQESRERQLILEMRACQE